MSKKTSKKKGLDTHQFNDRWSQIQGQLEALAREQVTADIELVNSQRALLAAQSAHKKAVARKSLAESRLNSVRSNLGVE